MDLRGYERLNCLLVDIDAAARGRQLEKRKHIGIA
jgi:hypothetical protein